MKRTDFDNELSVFYSSDDNYAQHMGVSIYSLLDNNRDFEKIRVFVIDNNISKQNVSKLIEMVKEFDNTEIQFIDFAYWKTQLKLNMEWNISISSYARLFVSGMLPTELKRVIYLDCDMIICGSLEKIWNIDLQENLIGAVQDSVGAKIKDAVGIENDQPYFNAGMLLIDLENWRKQNVEEKCMTFLQKHNGRVSHHDQGVLNGVLQKKVYFLPLKYNLMTIHYMLNREKILKYFDEKAEFYSTEEINNAKEHPVIIHYTPSFTSRPWVKGCRHPFKKYYWDILERTSWSGAKQQKNTQKWYVKLSERITVMKMKG